MDILAKNILQDLLCFVLGTVIDIDDLIITAFGILTKASMIEVIR